MTRLTHQDTRAGLQSGSIEILGKNGGVISQVSDLKNKKVGIINKGEGTMLAARILFNKSNIDSLKDINWVYLDEVKLRESLKKGEIGGVVLWQNDKMESDDFMVIYIASDVDAVASSGHAKHGNDFFYVKFAGIYKELVESSPLKAAGILCAWIQGYEWWRRIGRNIWGRVILGGWWNFVVGFCYLFFVRG